MSSISSVQSVSPNVNFKSVNTRLVSVEQKGDYEVRKYETEGSTGKKWGVGLASAFLPGLGQAINGDWGKGFGFFFGTLFTYAVGVIGMAKNSAASMLGALASLGIGIWSIVDAVKGAKTETVEIVRKDKSEKQEKSVDIKA